MRKSLRNSMGYLIEEPNRFLTPAQAAHILNISLSTLKKFIYTGKIKTLKTPGGHHRIRERDLLQRLEGTTAVNPNIDSTVVYLTQAFLSIVQMRQKFCAGHAARVAEISKEIAVRMKLSSHQIKRLYFAALAHDIGMCAISEAILNKLSPLTDEEYGIIKIHPLLGEKIFLSLEQCKDIAKIIRQHHERWDGGGYPDGLKGAAICLEARIVALAESFACMSAENSYKQRLEDEEARQEIEKNSKTQFDPGVVKYFFQFFKAGG